MAYSPAATIISRPNGQLRYARAEWHVLAWITPTPFYRTAQNTTGRRLSADPRRQLPAAGQPPANSL
ncbi:MAG: hypothetical protein M3Y48_18975 [Actinomycetota bacterium]|nr:hypothetical protein [Actinomycetota bacterium]